MGDLMSNNVIIGPMTINGNHIENTNETKGKIHFDNNVISGGGKGISFSGNVIHV